MLTGGGSWFGRVVEVVVGFFNPGIAGWLFILFFFIILFAIMVPISLRIGNLFVEPILWLYKSRNYSMGLSLTGSVTPRLGPLHWLDCYVGVGVGLCR